MTDERQPDADREEAIDPGLAREQQPQKGRKSVAGLVIGIVVVLAIVAIGAYYYVTGGPRPDARELLAEIVAKYQSAEHVQSQSTMKFEMTMGERATTIDSPISFTFSQPNRMVYDSGTGMQSSTMISDGTNMWVEMEIFDSVIKMPAPADVSELNLEEWAGMFGSGAMMQLPDVKSLVSGGFDVERLQSIAWGLPEGNEWYAALSEPANTWAMTVSSDEGPQIAIWIDWAERTVRQIAMEADWKAMMAGQGEEMDLEQMPEEMRAMFEDMRMRMVIEVESITFGEAPPEGTYEYSPPEGAEVIEASNIEDAMSRLMSEAMGEEAAPSADLIGAAPPDFIAQDLEGNKVQLSSFRGQPLILNLWATWCPPCREELPLLNQICNEYRDQGLQVVAVSTDAEVSEVTSFLEKSNLDFTILWLPPEQAGAVMDQYGVTGIPRTLYISANWAITDDATGLHSKSDMLDSVATTGVDVSR